MAIESKKAKSKAQQMAAGAALRAKKGEMPKKELKGASKSMLEMPKKKLARLARVERKGLPEKKAEEWLEVGADVEVILDDQKYLLEKGDKILVTETEDKAEDNA